MFKHNIELLIDPSYLTCDDITKLNKSDKESRLLLSSIEKKRQLRKSLTAQLNSLKKKCLDERKNINKDYYIDIYQKMIPPPPSPPSEWYTWEEEYGDELKEAYDEYISWQGEIMDLVNNSLTRDHDIYTPPELKINYYLYLIDNYLLDLNNNINFREELFGYRLDSIRDINLNTYLWSLVCNSLVYIIDIDYDNDEIWYQETEKIGPDPIRNFKRKLFGSWKIINLKKGVFRDFIPVQPIIYPSKIDNLQSRNTNILDKTVNISSGFYKIYVINDIRFNLFNLKTYFTICNQIDKINKYLSDPLKDKYLEYGAIKNWEDEIIYYDDIYYIDLKIDDRYHDNYRWN